MKYYGVPGLLLGLVVSACNAGVPFEPVPADLAKAPRLDLFEDTPPLPDLATPAPMCAPGTEDCDSLEKNGCETDITSDKGHCGNCATVCPGGAFATAACRAGRCTVDCVKGYADCDGRAETGCESTLATDGQNCGACGVNCVQGPNAVAVGCVAGRCVKECARGWGDCDGIAANGCEDPLNSALHCGACGRGCMAINAIATCAQGVCTLQCAPGFYDCDMNPGTGCEADPLTDAKNCGGCGNVCPQNAPNCSGGRCI